MNFSSDLTPFRINIAQSDVDDLQWRLDHTRWPAALPGVGWERGVPVDYLRRLVDYWRHDFDWRRQEAVLNEIPQFTTEIDGQTMHFVHVRSAENDATPVILTHGWPGSFIELINLIGPLTDPVAHGGDPADACHVVIPSLPSFGFSTPVRETGWGNIFRVAAAWAELMDRLGYEQFAAHGGDVGMGVTQLLPMVAPGRVLGTHVNGPAAFPFGPALDPTDLNPSDAIRAQRFNAFQQDGLGYLHLQQSRPQTIGYGLQDSPVLQLAWIVEKFAEWTDPAKALPEDAVDLDQLLTHVSVYWFTGSGNQSAHFTYEGMQAYRAIVQGFEGDDHASVEGPPAAAVVFAGDNSIRSVVDPDQQLVAWHEYDSGGHFPGMEVPGLLAQDLQGFLRTIRE